MSGSVPHRIRYAAGGTAVAVRKRATEGTYAGTGCKITKN